MAYHDPSLSFEPNSRHEHDLHTLLHDAPHLNLFENHSQIGDQGPYTLAGDVMDLNSVMYHQHEDVVHSNANLGDRSKADSDASGKSREQLESAAMLDETLSKNLVLKNENDVLRNENKILKRRLATKCSCEKEVLQRYPWMAELEEHRMVKNKLPKLCAMLARKPVTLNTEALYEASP